ncbi:helix-turn-helix transcriptional regulator [Burkholderia sp. BCC1993]|uniref:helix-turn-helix domain-containing protein n=1 Tax=Burkholderia sp. BCC1993 TaxID=2817444 RepID=UPI002AB0715B|nr:helix-turn-helix transcriptional regulator [Burkholderia sp. BCC1993]
MKASKLAKLRRKTYRDAYVKSLVEQGLAFQIKEMRLSRGLTQRQMAERLQLGGQSAVARLEDPSYGRMTLATLAKIAAFFDVAFTARMVPYSRFLVDTRDLSPESMHVESFEHEDEAGAIENAPEFVLIRHGFNVPTANAPSTIRFGGNAAEVGRNSRSKALTFSTSSSTITIQKLTSLEFTHAS